MHGIKGRLSAGVQGCTGDHGKAQCRGPGACRASWEGSEGHLTWVVANWPQSWEKQVNFLDTLPQKLCT